MREELEFVQERVSATLREVGRVLVGQEDTMRSLLVCVFTSGHALLEGVPGTAKTLMVRALARSMNLQFSRVQFTPDLMPSDVIGTNVYDLQRGEFVLRHGPVFTDLLLGDEINRSPAKTQAALLEAMQERRCTIDGVSYVLSPAFTVFATQNPIEFEGTYPLPEAQLDRFTMKIRVDYPTAEEELRILEDYNSGKEPHQVEQAGIQPVLQPGDVERCRRIVRNLPMRPELVRYVQQIVRATRSSDEVLVGSGPRGGIHLLLSAKAFAAFAGRDFVNPDDIQQLVRPVLRHRMVLQPEAEANGLTTDDALETILRGIPVPR